ncbi:hypothetical protein [Bartonella sp. CM120XJJH]|uniref:hypothetical protein n=1 Tax=Bartonella sp. CM120XJJH TaxID=3243544 RepID=UPI0035CED12D
MHCVGLGACWAFVMVWNVVGRIGGKSFCEWSGEVGMKRGVKRVGWRREHGGGWRLERVRMDKRRVCLRGGGAKRCVKDGGLRRVGLSVNVVR